jgi:hypothetical protein
MRTFRLFLAVALIAAVGVAVIPAGASAATGHASLSKFEKKQNKRIKKANKKANAAQDDIAALGDTLDNVKATLKAVTDAAPQLISGLKALQAALENDVAPALTAINDALTDPVTGLVGLNDARPQFGAFEPDGNMIDGTGRHGGQGPDTDAASNGGGLFVVDFQNEVGDRTLSVNVFPYLAAATPSGSAVTCDANPSYDSTCAGILGLTTDQFDGGSHVLVQIGSAGTPISTGFTVTAFSG